MTIRYGIIRATVWAIVVVFGTGNMQARQVGSVSTCGAGTKHDLASRDSVEGNVQEHDSPACDWIELGRARLTAARHGDLAKPGPLQPLGTDYAHGAGRAFMRAIELDPTSLDAALGLIEALTAQRGWPQEDDAMRSLRALSAAVHPAPPWLLLARARLERQRGDRDSTPVLLRRYLSMGGDSAIGCLELARELYHAGDDREARLAYLAGAAAADSPEGIALYRQSLAPIAAPGELAAFDSTSSGSIGDFIINFWARRDASAGRADGERLAENYRRLEVAERTFRPIGNPSSVLPFTMTDPAIENSDLSGEDATNSLLGQLFDGSLLTRFPQVISGYSRQGAIWLRHGPPDDIAGKFWKYDRQGRMLILDVGAGNFGDACDLSPRYCSGAALAGRPVPATQLRRWYAEWDTMMQRALTTDDYPLHFARSLKPIVNVYSLLAPSGTGGRALVVFAVRAGDLAARPMAADTSLKAYPLNFRVIAYAPSGAARFELDTTRWFAAPRSLEHDAWLTGTLVRPLPAGLYDTRVVIKEAPFRAPASADTMPVDSRGVVVGRDSMTVPGVGGSLAMSDLVPGNSAAGLGWWNGEHPLHLNPLAVWHRGEPLQLYYEVSGLRPGAALHTAIRLSQGEADNHAVTLTFTDRVRTPRQEFERALGTTRLAPGQYAVEVELTADGVSASRSTIVEITAP